MDLPDSPVSMGPSRPTSNSPVLQPMVSWPDMLRCNPRFPRETWSHPQPKGWRATNHVPRNPREFSDAILVYSDAMFIYFFCFLEVHRNRNCCKSYPCAFLESKHLQIYTILVKLKSSAFSLSEKCKIHQDLKRSKVLWIRLASSGPPLTSRIQRHHKEATLLANSWRARGKKTWKNKPFPKFERENTQQHSYNNVTNDVAFKDFRHVSFEKQTAHSFQSVKTEQEQEKKQSIPQNSTND